MRRFDLIIDHTSRNKNVMTDSVDLKKMYWHSRRGMLELDLLLVPFAEHKLSALNESQISDYERLLLEEDQDIYQWLVKKQQAPNVSLQNIIDIILSGSG